MSRVLFEWGFIGVFFYSFMKRSAPVSSRHPRVVMFAFLKLYGPVFRCFEWVNWIASWAMSKTLVICCIEGIILPRYIGIGINNCKDPGSLLINQYTGMSQGFWTLLSWQEGVNKMWRKRQCLLLVWFGFPQNTFQRCESFEHAQSNLNQPIENHYVHLQTTTYHHYVPPNN